ncbi:TetR/AcrR family transcriptional regulator [Streptomyces sp. HC44]|uniref:TetR/AcrR family transcriptional regulator n=1 Tax=Streptomyces scabichelini TaxID=2711217 RepID=A0A6G4VHJ2_9ACTN|nr:TetR/AcrR family transcriptional regulator [Streptomyces scabichelini]NGO13274.1 TetR/AcrR family transcriptional regulator [Streptomyces scabichelini]
MTEAVADLRADGHEDWRAYEPMRLPPILAHALDAIVEQGYHATTVRDLARRVGVTVPALYYHYANKQAILVELLLGSLRSVLGRCRTAVEEAGDDPVDRFGALVECIVLFMTHRAPLAFLDSEIRSLEPENRQRCVALRDELEGLLRDAVCDGAEAGVFTVPVPVEAGRAVLAMCQAVAQWYRPEGPLTPQEIAERYVTIALFTVGHRPEPADC